MESYEEEIIEEPSLKSLSDRKFQEEASILKAIQQRQQVAAQLVHQPGYIPSSSDEITSQSNQKYGLNKTEQLSPGESSKLQGVKRKVPKLENMDKLSQNDKGERSYYEESEYESEYESEEDEKVEDLDQLKDVKQIKLREQSDTQKVAKRDFDPRTDKLLDIKSDEDYLSIDTLHQKDMKNDFNPPPEQSVKGSV